jgi:hypothetical protein
VSQPASVPAALLAVALALTGGCTFNVVAFEREVQGETTEPFDRLRLDVVGAGAAFIDAPVVVRGTERVGASARANMAGLAGLGADPDALARGLRIEWPSGGDGVTELRLSYAGDAAENLWITSLWVTQAIGTGLDASAGSESFDVAGLDAPFVGIRTTSGAIRVQDADEVLLDSEAGSIDVSATTGVLGSRGGSIRMALRGPVVASTESGSIRGSFGGHGEISSRSGPQVLELTTPLTGDVLLDAESGSIELIVPRGAAMRLELSSQLGTIRVQAGDVSHQGGDFTGAIAGGGEHAVRARTLSGSITVREAS